MGRRWSRGRGSRRAGGSVRGGRVVVAVVLAAALTTGLLAVGSWNSSPRHTSGTRRLGVTRSGALVDFSLVLRLHQARLERFLAGLYDPGSPAYHHFIDARAFGHRFGVSDGQLSSVLASLKDRGIRVTEEYPQRTAIDAVAPAGVVDRLFDVRLMDYRGPGGRRYHAPLSTPRIPVALRGAVGAVAGLRGGIVPRPDDVPSGGVTPGMGAKVYDITPLYHQGISGQGETVAVVESSQYDQSDLDNFTHRFGLPPLRSKSVPTPQDGPAIDTSSDGEAEAELDVELIHEVAPDARILDYNAPSLAATGADSLGDMIDNIVAAGQTDIVSDSMGYCELGFPGADIQREEQAIEAAVAHGITIFKSTGDAGAYQCERFDPTNHELSVEWPASSPGVVAVGGTSLSVTRSGGYASENAWEDVLEDSGGGGGLSVEFNRPSWQRAPGVVNQFSDGKRQIPDVSADADPNTGWALYTGGSLGSVAGTSAAAPFWAGAMALVEQYAHAHGVKRLGFIDPMLYRLASTPQPEPPFHDVTVGTNRHYPATPGWDFATGLGSPDVYNLARDVVRYLQSHPAG